MNKNLISVRIGRIEDSLTDAVVSASNENYLVGGGGTSGSIEAKAGEVYSQRLQGEHCPTGKARITSAGHLIAEWVIHTTVPVSTSKESDEALFRSAVHATLDLAENALVKSISFPILGAGHFGWDTATAATYMIEAIMMHRYPSDHSMNLFPITIVAFTEKDAITTIKELAAA